jgi:hypothetical protein
VVSLPSRRNLQLRFASNAADVWVPSLAIIRVCNTVEGVRQHQLPFISILPFILLLPACWAVPENLGGTRHVGGDDPVLYSGCHSSRIRGDLERSLVHVVVVEGRGRLPAGIVTLLI